MKYKLLGQTGLRVSSLCFGTMSFGSIADEITSEKMYNRCREMGINFFDCANIYANGKSEEILGKLISSEREKVIITSKVYFPTGNDINSRGASRRNIKLEVEKSLKRLSTDWIDIYFIHHFDDDTPLHESIRALDDLIKQGKILHIGASNFAAWQIMKGLSVSERENLSKFEIIQPMYNLTKRQAEVEILPLALSENLGVISYSPLGGGLLTGKYNNNKKPNKGRLTINEMYKKRYGEMWMFEVAEKFSSIAENHGFSPAALAIRWVANNPAITSPIIGARNLEQLEESLGSLNITMSESLYEKISSLSPKPPNATDRTEEML